MMELKSCWIFCFLPVINGYCSSQTYYAHTDNSYIYHTYYSSNEDCTFTIKPRTDSRTARSHDDRGSSGDYFLEISWSDFDVRGKMPSCNNDYVEIFLTSSEKSIGRFCSDNLKGYSLFNMYSHDGYAKIKFHSDSSRNGRGFSLKFRLRSKSSDSLSGNDGCSSRYLIAGSDEFYTSDWPQSYDSGSTFDCKINIKEDGIKRIIFMDLNLRENYIGQCNKFVSDYVDIRGSNDYGDYNSAVQLKAPFCATDKIVTFTTSFSSVYVHIKGQRRASSSARGLVAGYVAYDEKTSSSVNVALIVSAVAIPVLLIILIVSVCVCTRHHRKQRQQQRQPVPTINQQTSYNSPYQEPVQTSPYPGMGQMPPSYEEAIAAPYQEPVSQENVTPDQNIRPPAYNPSYGST